MSKKLFNEVERPPAGNYGGDYPNSAYAITESNP